MVRKKVHYELDQGNISELAESELIMVLRAADDIIARGGRAMLAKILKGSKDKTILQYELQNSPAYGFYHDKTIKEITQIVDYCINMDFFEIEYVGKLPKIIYTAKGWEIEKKTYAKEYYNKLKQMVVDKTINLAEIQHLLKLNREVILLLLDMIENNRDTDLIDILLIWKRYEVKKVQKRINSIVNTWKLQKYI